MSFRTIAQSCFSHFALLISICSFSMNNEKASTNIIVSPWHRRENRDWYSPLETSVTSRLWSFSRRKYGIRTYKPIYRSFLYRNTEDHSAAIILLLDRFRNSFKWNYVSNTLNLNLTFSVRKKSHWFLLKYTIVKTT